MNNNNSNNLPAVFNYEGKQVRSVKIDGEAWLVAKDVCDILEIQRTNDATEGLDDDEKGTANIRTPGGMQNMTVINEAGLYKLTFRSRKPKAKEFTRWVTHDVLPEIRKTGCYVDPALKDANQTAMPAVRTEPKSYMSKARFNATTRIISLALNCKEEKDFQKVIALDNAFRARSGYSALDDAGFSLVTVKHSRDVEDLDPAFIWRDSRKRIHRTEYYYTFEWKHNLPVLPTSYIADE